MGLSIVMGVPNSWMAYFLENPMKMDDLEVRAFSRKDYGIHSARIGRKDGHNVSDIDALSKNILLDEGLSHWRLGPKSFI